MNGQTAYTLFLLGFVREFLLVLLVYARDGAFFFYSATGVMVVVEIAGWTVFHTSFIILLLLIRKSFYELDNNEPPPVSKWALIAVFLYSLIPLFNYVEIEFFSGTDPAHFSNSDLLFLSEGIVVYSEPLYISSVLTTAVIFCIFVLDLPSVEKPWFLSLYLNVLLILYYSVIGVTYRLLLFIVNLQHLTTMFTVSIFLLSVTVAGYRVLQHYSVERPLLKLISTVATITVVVLIFLKPQVSQPHLTLISFVTSNVLFTVTVIWRMKELRLVSGKTQSGF